MAVTERRNNLGVDRTTVLLGGAGCGCGVLLAVLALVALIGATALGSLPASKADPSRPDITITVQEAFLQQVMGQSLPGNILRDVSIRLQPGGVMNIQARVETTLLGQKLSAPFSLAMRLSARDGRLRLDVTELQISADQIVSATLRGVFSGAGDVMSQAINSQIMAGLGSDAYIMDVTTDDHHLVIHARWTGQ